MMHQRLFVLIPLISLMMDSVTSAQDYHQIPDWAYLSYYQADNAALGNPSANEKRVVFMGNSITSGWITTDPSFFRGRPYINRGISGQTTPQMLIRFRQDVIDLDPAVVVILAGTNDIAGNTGPTTLEAIFDNIVSMTELARANHIQVVLCSVLPVYDYPWRPGLEPAENIIALNQMIREYCMKEHITYVDYHTPMSDDRKGLKKIYGEDGVHPNLAGYTFMEPLVEDGIAKALKKK